MKPRWKEHWDFTVNFSPIGALMRAAAAQLVSDPAADPSASDPSGAPLPS